MMKNNMEFASLHKLIKQQVDDELIAMLEQLDNTAPRLKQAMQHSLTNGGKRIRPLLVHLLGNTLDIPKRDQLAISMAIECIHAYSLIHDDLPAMDDDDLRRGQPTCHKAFDEATAILAGDALQTQAFTILATYPMSDYATQKRIQLVAILAQASGYHGMCGGQAIDLAATGKVITIEQLTQLHQCKTGALLNACVEMICAIADQLSEQEKCNLQQFSRSIGLVFQIQDDILDVTASTAVMGKPAGSDEALGKNTFVSLLGLDQAKKELTRLHQEALQALSSLPYNSSHLVAFTDLMIKRNH
jgi:farnesyl diphosphate synthase